MWGAITAAVVMGGLVLLARIAVAALREHQRTEDVAALADQVAALAEGVASLEEDLSVTASRVAGLQASQALGRRGR